MLHPYVSCPINKKSCDEAELLHNYPSLSGFDLENAWRYYDRHRAEIDRIIVSDRIGD
jgi:uncharacterized protein (DUF433 family)